MTTEPTDPQDDPQEQSVDGPIMADPGLEPVDLDGLTEDEVRRLSDDDLRAIEEICRKELLRRHN
jgi:hypothetical protein